MIKIKHALSDRGDDLYETPPEATRALLAVERLPLEIWEPACGRGAISEVLKAAGHVVYSTDLVEYGYGAKGIDFLLHYSDPVMRTAACIVTNPPYRFANEFVRQALRLSDKVVMLLRLQFLEGTRRSDILDGGRLRRVHVFRNRLPMMHRDGWNGPRATSTTAFAWFVWEEELGPTVINRISWGDQ